MDATVVDESATASVRERAEGALSKPALVCPAGSLRAAQLAVDAGADAVYMGLKGETNARNFAGLNFDLEQARDAVRYAHARGRQLYLALNTYARAEDFGPWMRATDAAAELGADALICADVAVMAYARREHPKLRLHLSVQASATNYAAIEFYRQQFGIQRAVLPRVLTLSQVAHVIRNTRVPIEVFGFGSLCVMVEGRCALSSYATGHSPNTWGVCSPPASVRWHDSAAGVQARLNGVLIDCYAPHEGRGYPTLCKGRFMVGDERGYALEQPTSLNTLAILPQLMRAGVAAVKIEGRQRSPSYVEQVTRVWRSAIDACAQQPDSYQVRAEWDATLGHYAEGQQQTLGAFDRPWS